MLGQFTLLGQLLTRTESFVGDRVLLTWQNLADLGQEAQRVPNGSHQGCAAASEDTGQAQQQNTIVRGSDDLYKHLQSVENNEIVVFIKEEQGRECSVGLRSRGTIDVGEMARALGGGGHAGAAGFTSTGSIEDLRRLVLDVLGRHYGLEF